MVVPEGSKPGETITIVGVAASAPFNSFKDIQDAAINNALALNSYFKIQERAVQAQTTVLNKVTELDTKYEITKIPLVVSGTAVAKKYAELALAKAKELDEKHKIVEKAKEIGNRIVVYALEIDAKFAISATTARLIITTSNAVVQTYTGAKDRVVLPSVEYAVKQKDAIVDYATTVKSQYFPTAPSAAVPVK